LRPVYLAVIGFNCDLHLWSSLLSCEAKIQISSSCEYSFMPAYVIKTYICFRSRNQRVFASCLAVNIVFFNCDMQYLWASFHHLSSKLNWETASSFSIWRWLSRFNLLQLGIVEGCVVWEQVLNKYWAYFFGSKYTHIRICLHISGKFASSFIYKFHH